MQMHRRGLLKNPTILVFLIALLAVGMGSAGFSVYARSREKVVTVVDDGSVVQFVTSRDTVEEMFAEYDIVMEEGDTVSPSVGERITDGLQVSIERAFSVRITADGETKTVRLQGGTVEEALRKAGVTLRETDIISNPLYADVRPGMEITVQRVDEKIAVERETIPYQVVTRKNNDMDEGKYQVIQEGQEGEKEVRFLIKYVDGQEVARNYLDETVLTEPVDRIVEKGTVKTMTTARGETIRYTDMRLMQLTAYEAGPHSTGKTPDHPNYGRTGSGRRVQEGHTVAAHKSIPLYTRLYIPYMIQWYAARGIEIDGIFEVEDRGGGIKEDQLDIYMESLAQCRQFGRRRNVKVYFLK
jgi:uncharacterized protein YabE (DUF348 family)